MTVIDEPAAEAKATDQAAAEVSTTESPPAAEETVPELLAAEAIAAVGPAEVLMVKMAIATLH